ncbi:MAG: hypothetical protein J6Y78_13995 [Paludibacteraceae bacterium]|nr:hypothetical protein [Paludibacteraceae bacterium]
MKRTFFYTMLCVVILGLTSCQQHVLTEEEAQSAVLNGEQERLPLVLQSMSDVESITIDSMRIHVKDEPMSGFLYTTWTYNVTISYYPQKVEKREKSIIVPVNDIRQSQSHDGYVEWRSSWDEAHKVIRDDIFNSINEIRKEEIEKIQNDINSVMGDVDNIINDIH